MPIAAVPLYMQKDDAEFYLSAPPGHRFLFYFAAWGENQETGMVDWRMKDRVPKIDKKTRQQKRGKAGPEWEDLPNDQYACTIAACQAPRFDEETPRKRRPKTDPGLKPWDPVAKALLRRQAIAAAQLAEHDVLRLDAIATAPFSTGLGNEHPLENGFAFLNPYGLPYLPGSGVKGVLRQAARELAGGEWGDMHGWRNDGSYVVDVGKDHIALSMIDVLFGLESRDGGVEHVRGALSFWDVIPQVKGNKLMVEIMTPHQSHYYQQKPSAELIGPHDSGSPNPISFLTVPPGSDFAFHVLCDAARLAGLTHRRLHGAPDLLCDRDTPWKTLLERAFEHAFSWLGFGAKTAVGYGAMRRDEDAEARAAKARAEREEKARRQREADERAARLAALTVNERRIEAFKEEFAARAAQLRGGKDRPNTAYHDKARKLAKDAHEGADWTPTEKRAAALAIEEWLPKVVQIDLKDEKKKLKLAVLKGEA